MPVPTPESLAGYDKLGPVAILIFVILFGSGILIWAVKQVRSVAVEVLKVQRETAAALGKLSDGLDHLTGVSEREHERLDHLTGCTRSGCPVFTMRRQLQKDAARAAAGNPVSSTPPPHATPATP